MSKLHPGVWRLAKYVIPLAGLVPVAFGISVALEKLAPEKAQAALSTVPTVQSPAQRETATSAAKVALLIANANYPGRQRAAQSCGQGLAGAGRSAAAQRLRRRPAREPRQGRDDARASTPSRAKIRPGTVALVSFAGFGIQADRQSYLIPVNAQIWRETDVRREGISIDSVLADMHERGAGVKLAILDASRRNPFERRFRAYSAGLAAIDAPQGTLLMSAAAPGKVAYDGPSENSLLIGELLKEIVLPGQSAEAVFNHTRLGVSRASNGEQVPQVSSSLAANFTFVPGNAKVASLSSRDTMIDEPRVTPRQTVEPAETGRGDRTMRSARARAKPRPMLPALPMSARPRRPPRRSPRLRPSTSCSPVRRPSRSRPRSRSRRASPRRRSRRSMTTTSSCRAAATATRTGSSASNPARSSVCAATRCSAAPPGALPARASAASASATDRGSEMIEGPPTGGPFAFGVALACPGPEPRFRANDACGKMHACSLPTKPRHATNTDATRSPLHCAPASLRLRHRQPMTWYASRAARSRWATTAAWQTSGQRMP